MSSPTIEDFLDGLSDRVGRKRGDTWTPGIVYLGASDRVETVHHRGETIRLEDFERRLKKYEEEHGPIEGGGSD